MLATVQRPRPATSENLRRDMSSCGIAGLPYNIDDDIRSAVCPAQPRSVSRVGYTRLTYSGKLVESRDLGSRQIATDL